MKKNIINTYLIFNKLLTFIRLFFYKVIWLQIKKWAIFHWFWIKITTPNLIQIWNNFQIWRFSKLSWKIIIWNDVFINEFWSINAWWQNEWRIEIWNDVMFWPFCFLQSWDHWIEKWVLYRLSKNWISKPIIIWNNVWIWANVTILKGVSIWDNSIIWAWSVVIKNIPSNSIAVWNPCKSIKEII